MKICAIICSHSDPVFTKLTISSLMKTVGQHHDLTVHVGIHSNYNDYTGDFSLLREFEKTCQFHMVDEIDWNSADADILRYSKMHAKNMENLFRHVKFYEFDYLLVLDNDLHIKEDFVSKYIDGGEDIVGCLFREDIPTLTALEESAPVEFKAIWGDKFYFMPKISAWHVMISRKGYDVIMQNLDKTRPEVCRPQDYGLDLDFPIIFDTFSKVKFFAKEWGLQLKLVPASEMEKSVKHFFGSSFNYGSRAYGPDQLAIIEDARRTYQENF